MRRLCLDCGQVTSRRMRCASCERAREHERYRQRPHYRHGWAATRDAMLRAWREQYGDVCPGWRRPPHAATDLTVDHVIPRSTRGGLRVLCRSCNSTRGARAD